MGSRQAKPDAALRRLAQGLYPWRGRARWGKLLSGPCGPGTVRPARARDFNAQEAPVEDPIAGTSRFANAFAARGPERPHSAVASRGGSFQHDVTEEFTQTVERLLVVNATVAR